jgi:hypothetical protein
MADRTSPIVRPGVTNRMVTKGYRKGVYERVTKGISGSIRAVPPQSTEKNRESGQTPSLSLYSGSMRVQKQESRTENANGKSYAGARPSWPGGIMGKCYVVTMSNDVPFQMHD